MSWNNRLKGIIQTDRFDERVYKEVHEASERLREIEKVQGMEFDSFPSLLQDTWASLYKASPEINEEIPSSLKLNEHIIRSMLDSTEYKELHQTTKLDEWSAALGAMALSETIMKDIPDQMKQLSNQMEQAQKELQKLLDLAQAYRDASDASGEESHEHMALEAEMDAGVAEEKLNDLSQQMEDLLERGKTKFKQAIRQAVEKTSDQVDQTNRQLSTWGVGRGDGKPVSGKERLELAQRLFRDTKLQQIAELAGRMENIALAKQKTKTQYPPSEVVDITMGNDLAHVLPSELVLLKNPATRKDFLRRFAEGKLLQYDLIGYEREGKGPIVVLCDSSYSMKGSREVWSKAVTMALFTIARKQKRPFACTHFGSESELQTFQFKHPNQSSPSELMDMCSFFFGGGTDFMAPLREGMKIIEDSTFKKADLILITDGEAEVTDKFLTEFRQLKKNKEFNVITILLETFEDESVKPFSDYIAYGYTDQTKNGEAFELLFNI